ncbi:hypothetical protein [Cedecea sp.]|jgi:hypothetical protein|uniref:hypothetical protein n=1 Tax=Cedecea sp. TaxID=1970739 RepID=UPI002F41E18E
MNILLISDDHLFCLGFAQSLPKEPAGNRKINIKIRNSSSHRQCDFMGIDIAIIDSANDISDTDIPTFYEGDFFQICDLNPDFIADNAFLLSKKNSYARLIQKMYSAICPIKPAVKAPKLKSKDIFVLAAINRGFSIECIAAFLNKNYKTASRIKMKTISKCGFLKQHPLITRQCEQFILNNSKNQRLDQMLKSEIINLEKLNQKNAPQLWQ